MGSDAKDQQESKSQARGTWCSSHGAVGTAGMVPYKMVHVQTVRGRTTVGLACLGLTVLRADS